MATTDKVRMKVTVTFEYDANPAHYEGRKPVDMADLDRMDMEEDFGHFVSMISETPLTITVEPINGNL